MIPLVVLKAPVSQALFDLTGDMEPMEISMESCIPLVAKVEIEALDIIFLEDIMAEVNMQVVKAAMVAHYLQNYLLY